jgi:hypothetical protein
MKPPLADPSMGGKSCNPAQIANLYAHRPEVRDLGWLFYSQVNRIRARWRKAELRVERKKRELEPLAGDEWE